MSIAYDGRQSQNAYASPKTSWATADETEPERTTRWLFFSLEGRITRGQFWTASILTYAAYVGFLVAMEVLSGSVRYDALKAGVLLCGAAVFIWTMVAIQVKRWHDRGKPGVCVLLLIIPILGPLWTLIELGFLAGHPFGNDYGPPATSEQWSRATATRQPATHSSVARNLACFALSAESQPATSSVRTAARRLM